MSVDGPPRRHAVGLERTLAFLREAERRAARRRNPGQPGGPKPVGSRDRPLAGKARRRARRGRG